MKKQLASTFAFVAAIAINGQTAHASTQLSRVFSDKYQNTLTPTQVRDGSKETAAVWPSTAQGQTQQFEGYFIATSPAASLAVRSDDGVSISKNGSSILNNLNVGQHWPDDSSFSDLGGGWTQNVPYKVVVSYKTSLSPAMTLTARA